MTVKELKEALDCYPDDMGVIVSIGDHDEPVEGINDNCCIYGVDVDFDKAITVKDLKEELEGESDETDVTINVTYSTPFDFWSDDAYLNNVETHAIYRTEYLFLSEY